jgi:hypothetical protein
MPGRGWFFGVSEGLVFRNGIQEAEVELACKKQSMGVCILEVFMVTPT